MSGGIPPCYTGGEGPPDYLLFKQIVLLMLNKEHNTLEGIQKTVNIRASLNTGLSKDLKEAFPMTIPVTLNVESTIKNNNLHPEWVAGFSTGESRGKGPLDSAPKAQNLTYLLLYKNLKLRVVYLLHYVFQ